MPRPPTYWYGTAVDSPTVKQIYGCIDGIGPDTADDDSLSTTSLSALIATAPEELLAIESLGPERTEAIYPAFGDGA